MKLAKCHSGLSWSARPLVSEGDNWVFNHKIGNGAHSGVSEVLFFTKSYKGKKQ